MRLAGLQKLTLLDFPDRTAATVFTAGCDFRCPFCHNSDLVIGSAPTLSSEEFFAFLDTRQGLLDGVCISGGEPLLQSGMEEFCRQVRQRGFVIKLDTNGNAPDKMIALIEQGLIDFVALDVKNAPSLYGETTGVPCFDIESIGRSIDYLLAGSVDYELRTTVVREYHNQESLEELAWWIRGTRAWFLQGFIDSERVIAGSGLLHGYTESELYAILPALQQIVPTVQLRGI